MTPFPRIVIGLALCASMGSAQDWNLSGKVVDAEEGNGLNEVKVTLKTAGLTIQTPKNGTWVLGTPSSVLPRFAAPSRSGVQLVMDGGRLSLSFHGVDPLGRGFPGTATAEAMAGALRQAAVVDSLVFEKEGYHRKSIALDSKVSAGRVDSIRRIRYDGWVDSSHSNRKADTLNGFTRGPRTLTLRWSKQNWDRMMRAMADSCGAFGTKGAGDATSKLCSEGQFDYIEKSAMIWVPADIEADGQIWKNVGVRLKGNWSLRSAWTSKNYALPFRFNTDKFEDSLPETKNQRFYGFQKVSFYNAVQDPTGIRSAVTSSIFRQSGVPAPLSVPVHLILKFGDTTKDVGAYEMVEVPDEPLLSRLFGNDSGNLYKPESKLDQYVASEWMDEDIPGDRTDAKNLISVINATNRTSDSATWHRNLDSVLDVDGFLRWLAASTVIMNWDSYGVYGHNYYLFNDNGRFRWITYDFGNSFNYTMGSRTSIWYNEPATPFGTQGPWPLIKNLLADKTYCEKYRTYATQAVAGPAGGQNFQSLVDKYGQWVSGIPSTVSAVSSLRTFMPGRISEVQNSLCNETCPIQ